MEYDVLKTFIENVLDVSCLFSLRQCNKTVKNLCDERFKTVYNVLVDVDSTNLYEAMTSGVYDPAEALGFAGHYGIVYAAVKEIVKGETQRYIWQDPFLSAVSIRSTAIGIGETSPGTTALAIMRALKTYTGGDISKASVLESLCSGFSHGVVIANNVESMRVILTEKCYMRDCLFYFAFSSNYSLDSFGMSKRYRVQNYIIANAPVDCSEWRKLYVGMYTKRQFFYDRWGTGNYSNHQPYKHVIGMLLTDDVDRLMDYSLTTDITREIMGIFQYGELLTRPYEKWPMCFNFLSYHYFGSFAPLFIEVISKLPEDSITREQWLFDHSGFC